MNFLNPLALIGLVAAGIPVLLHLLNLRKLRTVDFGTLRFLQELQQSRVRRIKIQQILLLILRTLLVVFAVLAFSRPTISSNLPLLSTSERTSVVLLVDNSASMEAADQRGRRFQQSIDAALAVIDGLQPGDEVCVMPMCGGDAGLQIGFTRTLDQARADLQAMTTVEATAYLAPSLGRIDALLVEAAHAHREVYVFSDAQKSLAQRASMDSSTMLQRASQLYLVHVGKGLSGVEPNYSIDSIAVHTAIVQPDRPLEVEAWIRNGSDRDATAVVVTMSFNGVGVAQRTVDIPAGTTRSVVLTAPPQKRGTIAVAAEIDNDAIDGDNARYTSVFVPPVGRFAVVGSTPAAEYVATAVAVAMNDAVDAQNVQRFRTLAEAMPRLTECDALFVVDGPIASAFVPILEQYVQDGGAVVVFASDDPSLMQLTAPFQLSLSTSVVAPARNPWLVHSLDETHPLFYGVFEADRSGTPALERIEVLKQRSASGGVTLAATDAGAFLTESARGAGRLLYVAVNPDPSWGSFAGTGFFAAVVVRSALYAMVPQDERTSAMIGQPLTIPVPGRWAGEKLFRLRETGGVTSDVAPARLPSQTLLQVPSQERAGVVFVTTQNGVDVAAASVNVPRIESLLEFMDADQWQQAAQRMVDASVDVTYTEPGKDLQTSMSKARIGSELWPLSIMLALLCAVAESAVSRMMARDATASGTA